MIQIFNVIFSRSDCSFERTKIWSMGLLAQTSPNVLIFQGWPQTSECPSVMVSKVLELYTCTTNINPLN